MGMHLHALLNWSVSAHPFNQMSKGVQCQQQLGKKKLISAPACNQAQFGNGTCNLTVAKNFIRWGFFRNRLRGDLKAQFLTLQYLLEHNDSSGFVTVSW